MYRYIYIYIYTCMCIHVSAGPPRAPAGYIGIVGRAVVAVGRLAGASGRRRLGRGKGLHTRNQHLRNHRGFSMAFANGFSLAFPTNCDLSLVCSKGCQLFLRMFTRLVQFAGASGRRRLGEGLAVLSVLFYVLFDQRGKEASFLVNCLLIVDCACSYIIAHMFGGGLLCCSCCCICCLIGGKKNHPWNSTTPG